MLTMEQPLLCFSPCQNKNTTKNLFTALSFQRLPKVRFSYGARDRRNRSFYETRLSSPSRLQQQFCSFPSLNTKSAFISAHSVVPCNQQSEKEKLLPTFRRGFFLQGERLSSILGFIKSSLNNLKDNTNFTYCTKNPRLKRRRRL